MRALVLLVLFTAGAPEARARPASTIKAEGRREESRALAEQILRGEGVSAAISRLSFLGEPDAALPILGTGVSSQDPRVRRDVAAALAELGAPDSEGLLVALARDQDGAVRVSAARGLGRLHTRQQAVLELLLRDPTAGVRGEAARALGALQRRALGKRLVSAAQQEGDLDARAAMLVAAGEAGDVTQAPSIERFLSSSSENTRTAAARALVLLGAAPGIAYARRQLASTDRYERREAVALFEGTRLAVARPVLMPLLADQDERVSARAARILYQAGQQDALTWLVVNAAHATGDHKAALEDELERLELSDDARRAILDRAGVP